MIYKSKKNVILLLAFVALIPAITKADPPGPRTSSSMLASLCQGGILEQKDREIVRYRLNKNAPQATIAISGESKWTLELDKAVQMWAFDDIGGKGAPTAAELRRNSAADPHFKKYVEYYIAERKKGGRFYREDLFYEKKAEGKYGGDRNIHYLRKNILSFVKPTDSLENAPEGALEVLRHSFEFERIVLVPGKDHKFVIFGDREFNTTLMNAIFNRDLEVKIDQAKLCKVSETPQKKAHLVTYLCGDPNVEVGTEKTTTYEADADAFRINYLGRERTLDEFARIYRPDRDQGASNRNRANELRKTPAPEAGVPGAKVDEQKKQQRGI